MNSTKFIIIAIALVIGLALTPVVASQTSILTDDPGCGTGMTPRRATAAGVGTAAGAIGNVFCATRAPSASGGTVPASGDTLPSSSGGRFSSLYAGPATDRSTGTPGTFVGAGSIIELVPLIYIVGILLVPVGMVGMKLKKM